MQKIINILIGHGHEQSAVKLKAIKVQESCGIIVVIKMVTPRSLKKHSCICRKLECLI